MAVLTASNVGQSFGAYDVFRGVNVAIPRDGKIGLVGPNGVGKTTLLLIMAGQQTPSSGHIHVAKGVRLGYLSQESSDAFAGRDHTVFQEMLTVFDRLRADEARLRNLEQAMAEEGAAEALFEEYSQAQVQFELDGGYEYDRRIKQVLTGLGFKPDTWDQPLTQLSGGQKTRVLLARLLLEQPDLLILDEPTNHLDVQAIEWLETTLGNWSGAVLVVSHDRYFLDRFANTIWEMSQSGIESYRGNYSAYARQRQERWERQMANYEAFQERVAKEMDFIRRNIAGQRTQMAQGKLSRLSREIEAVRAGGLGVLSQLGSQGWLQLSNSLNLQRPAATVSELQAAINDLPSPIRPPVVNVQLRSAYRSGNLILRTNDMVVGYPERPLFAADDMELYRRECVALIGPNGSGKTTFLRVLLGELEPLEGDVYLGASLKIGYFAQVQDALNPENTVLDELLARQHMTISEARNYLARYLFRGDDVFSKVSVLSGGEKARLALAMLVLEEANFLLLDEPTNHLDIPSQEVLQEALEPYDGTILLVTHDRYLVDRLATQIWELQPGDSEPGMRLNVFKGPYQEYLAAKVQRPPASDQNGEPASAGPSSNGTGLSKNELRRRAERQADLETQIGLAESELAGISEALQSAAEAQDLGELQRLTAAYQGTERTLERLLKEWEVLAHESAHHSGADG